MDQFKQREEKRDAHPLVVQRATAVENAVDDLAGEGGTRPLFGLRRDDVDVVVEDQRPERLAARDARHD